MNAVGVIFFYLFIFSFFSRQEFHSIKRFGLLWKQALLLTKGKQIAGVV